MEKDKILGFGEVMLRLCPSEFKRIRQCLPGSLDATFGGGEANVCASVSMFGSNAKYLTALPNNPVTESFFAQMRGVGVDVSSVLLKENSRMGIYYVETGANQRASSVIYDREFSAISMTGPEEYDFQNALEGVKHVHITGITPSLSEKAFNATLELVKHAQNSGAKVSCDLNYRKKLWNWHPEMKKQKLADYCMSQIVPYVDIVIANEEDATDVFGIVAENSSITSGHIDTEGYKSVAKQIIERFENVSQVAITLRESKSATHNNWGAMLFDKASDKAFFAPIDGNGNYTPYQIKNIVDRVGGGDSFGAGLIHALYSDDLPEKQDVISFAVAASCLKHSIKGDFNYVTRSEVLSLMGGDASGRVKR
ncbi:MAG: sugar kinase [Kiritimatiellae bacterium]|jgi:2-dehydro-3-deoxygluconokinase|nr:sugar kinase [Kiritimatiellia bacterium]